MNNSKKWIGLFLAGLMVISLIPATVMAKENNAITANQKGRMGTGVASGIGICSGTCEQLYCECDFDTVQERILKAIDNHIVKIEESEDLDEDEKEELVDLLEEARDSVEEAEDIEELREIMAGMADELRGLDYHPLWNMGSNSPRFSGNNPGLDKLKEHFLDFIDRAIARLEKSVNFDDDTVEEYTDKLGDMKENVEDAGDKAELHEAMKETREVLRELREETRGIANRE